MQVAFCIATMGLVPLKASGKESEKNCVSHNLIRTLPSHKGHALLGGGWQHACLELLMGRIACMGERTACNATTGSFTSTTSI